MTELPTAVFAANNVLAESCLFVLKDLGLLREVSLIVFDDAPWMQLIERPLTVVVQPIEELARTAAKLVLERVQEVESRNPVSIVLEPTLIIRDSTDHVRK